MTTYGNQLLLTITTIVFCTNLICPLELRFLVQDLHQSLPLIDLCNVRFLAMRVSVSHSAPMYVNSIFMKLLEAAVDTRITSH